MYSLLLVCGGGKRKGKEKNSPFTVDHPWDFLSPNSDTRKKRDTSCLQRCLELSCAFLPIQYGFGKLIALTCCPSENRCCNTCIFWRWISLRICIFGGSEHVVYTEVMFKGMGLHRTTKLERVITCAIKPCKLLTTRAKPWTVPSSLQEFGMAVIFGEWQWSQFVLLTFWPALEPLPGPDDSGQPFTGCSSLDKASESFASILIQKPGQAFSE